MKHIQEKFEKVALGLWRMIENKATLYGWSRFNPHSEQFNYWMCFSDIHRKTLRLEGLTSLSLAVGITPAQRKQARDKLVDDYKDIANYAIMAVIILEENGDEV